MKRETSPSPFPTNMLSGPRRIFSSPKALKIPMLIDLGPVATKIVGTEAPEPDPHGFARLADSIARQFEEILGVVDWNLSLIGQECDPLQRGAIENAQCATASASALVDTLRFVAGRGAESWSDQIDARELLTRVATLCRGTQESRVRVDTRLETSSATLIGNANRLQQAIMALVVNSMEACARTNAPRIELALRYEKQRSELREPRIVVSIRDNGAGMPPDIRDRIGQPFFTSKRPSGIGLGYAVVWAVVREMGAVMDVVSELGEGTLVSMSFPPASELKP